MKLHKIWPSEENKYMSVPEAWLRRNGIIERPKTSALLAPSESILRWLLLVALIVVIYNA